MSNALYSRRVIARALAIAFLFVAAGAASMKCWASPSERNGKVTGTVVDFTSAVITNAAIIFTDADAKEFRVTTGALGNFEASLPPSKYGVRVEVRGFRSEHRTVDVLPQSVVHLTFTLEIAKSDTPSESQSMGNVDQLEIPDSKDRLRIEYGTSIRRAQSEKETTYEDVATKATYSGPRAVIIRYRDVTIWATKLELFERPTVAEASGYVLLDDGINLPKHAEHVRLHFEKGDLKLEMPH
jgi:hypothetical protein